MYDSAYPFPVGKAVAGATGSLDGLLGVLYVANDGKMYRLCKNSADITAAASKGVVTAFTAGVPTWVTALPSAATTQDVVFIPAGQTGSGLTSTTLLANDYFWGQVSGPAVFLAANTATVKTGAQVLQVNTTGFVQSYVSSGALEAGTNIQATNSAGASSAGATITGFIAGLI